MEFEESSLHAHTCFDVGGIVVSGADCTSDDVHVDGQELYGDVLQEWRVKPRQELGGFLKSDYMMKLQPYFKSAQLLPFGRLREFRWHG